MFEFVVFDHGKAMTQLATRTDRAVLWELRRQDVVACTNATLTGHYGIGQAGVDRVANWEFVIVDGGREVFQLVTPPPRGTILWTLRKQSAQ
jgi:hypothetical protein